MDKVKVLHVVGRMDRGGAETLLMNMLHTLDRCRFQFEFVEHTQKHCDYDDEIEALGGQIYRCPPVCIKSLFRYRFWWRTFFKEHPEYTIVHGHSCGFASIYLQEAARAGRVTIIHAHSNSYEKGLKGLIRYIWQFPLHWAANYYFACSQSAGILQFGRRRKFEVIKNGIRSELFSWNPERRVRIRKELGLSDSLVIGNVARFETPKNHPFLLKIFREIKMLYPNSTLLLVGSGSKEPEIRAQAAEYGILDDIIFTGVRNDVFDLYQAIDVVAFPSLYEGLPLALVEAQTAGLPCFVSDTVSPETAITDLVHFLPLSLPPKQWAKEILRGIIPEGERRDHRDDIIRAGYDIRDTADKLCAFYTDVMQT